MATRILALGVSAAVAIAFISLNGQGHARLEASDLIAQSAGPEPKECPNNNNLETLCGAIFNGFREPPGHINYYKYQTLIYDASCVSDDDTPEILRAKVQAFWNRYGKEYTCRSSVPGVDHVNLLKFALYRRNMDFLDDAISEWRVDLNRVDPVDGTTLLDAMESAMRRALGTSQFPSLEQYHQKMRRAGAKLAREL